MGRFSVPLMVDRVLFNLRTNREGIMPPGNESDSRLSNVIGNMAQQAPHLMQGFCLGIGHHLMWGRKARSRENCCRSQMVTRIRFCNIVG